MMKYGEVTTGRRVRGFEPCGAYKIEKNGEVTYEFNPNEHQTTHPQRQTPQSAGYDIAASQDVTIKPGESARIPTGLTTYMLGDEFLDLRLRSGMDDLGLILLNGAGVIDADYYRMHFQVPVMNLSKKTIEIKTGQRVAQGIFSKYLLADDDRPANQQRTGGFNSTGM